MTTLSYIIFGIYIVGLSYITIYCLMQFHLLLHYRRHHAAPTIKEDTGHAEWPMVTVQLPIYNEMYVVERLVDNITSLDYPKDKLQIHILEDSTDETVSLSKKKCAEYRAQGFDIEVIQREGRAGYKAGALKAGMAFAKGEFIAIFDADFLPNTDFLKKTIPYFKNPKVGVVQTRWEHINQDYSLITQLQAFQLNVHFTVEQQGRKAGDFLLQFNGTAGVWRTETIEDAGGWEADTLTEDLDLSYRAQLKGWKIEFREEVGSPAELPAEMNGLKSQQYRWMKGGAETARKMLPSIWKSDISLGKKIHGTIHLLNSSVFLFIFLIGIFSVPILFFLAKEELSADYLGVFLISLVSIILVYYQANAGSKWAKGSKMKNLIKFLILFPVFLALSMGLSFHNSIAVLQGYRGKRSPFVRTPKYNIVDGKDSYRKRNYLASKLNFTTIMEGLLAIYFLGAFVLGIYLNNMTFSLFHLLLMMGYGSIFAYSVLHLKYKA